MRDRASFVIAAACIAAWALLGVWVTFYASCDSIGWVPVKDLPARCLERGGER